MNLIHLGERCGVHTVEIPVNNNRGKYPLPDDAILRNKRILGFFTTANNSGNVKSPCGAPLVANDVAESAYLSISKGKGNNYQVDKLPFAAFTVTDDNKDPFLIDMQEINTSRSEINLGDTTNVVVDTTFVIHFIYEQTQY